MRMTAFLHIELLTITRSCANTTWFQKVWRSYETDNKK